jgi:hypothetical protein
MTGDPKIPPLLDALKNAAREIIHVELSLDESVREILECLDAAGYVIVPKEPTFEMMEAALRAGVGKIYMPGGFERDADKYRAMLAASQQKGG